MRYNSKSNKELPKKQVHIYVYEDVERILKAHGYKTSEFVTLKSLELLNEENLSEKYDEIKKRIKDLETKKKKLTEDLNNCENQLKDYNERLKNMNRLIEEYDPSRNYEAALDEVYHLVGRRLHDPERSDKIYLNDVFKICDKYEGVNYEFLLSKVDENVLETHFTLKFKNKS